MDNPLHIVFAGGVTGGHLFPGLAVAEQIGLKTPGSQITFFGPGGALDRSEVVRAGHAYFEIDCPRAPRGFWRFPRFAQRLMLGQRQADAFLCRHRAAVVIGLGGFASAPAALAATRRRVPLVLLEQNAVLGRANRWLSRWAKTLCQSFDETAHTHGVSRGVPIVTGTPIRAEFNFSQNNGNSDRVLLVLGGSGGARALNEAMPPALAGLKHVLPGWRIIHQSGESAQGATQAAYREVGVDATVVPFIVDMADTLGRAELAVCRAGGSTLAELAATQTPALLVPFPHATDDHQRHNAQRFERAGAAALVDSKGLSTVELATRLRVELSHLLLDGSARRQMGQSMATLARPRAAQQVAEIVLSLAAQNGPWTDGNSRVLRTAKSAISPALPTLD
ncbi:MAG TPA: UDP-N-acetylglucosamine--N-acetylmuramyl-(pentapeptide) pyrophosphoryl-undecaprenol N-acetylglucosamine transferase [Pirellulales bacterium]|jgi:UDP-N-acetylglucosamine--N-acetylmuramyl-(pentapeptide) pyrophosphoryl-undecaprenol N-acetylglucosamine transferase